MKWEIFLNELARKTTQEETNNMNILISMKRIELIKNNREIKQNKTKKFSSNKIQGSCGFTGVMVHFMCELD